jgi:hypothetical protein
MDDLKRHPTTGQTPLELLETCLINLLYGSAISNGIRAEGPLSSI